MRIRVFVSLKEKILDPQGRAVRQALQTLGYTHVKDVRIGKYIELEIAPQQVDTVKRQVTDMCERLLANPVIEEYRFEIDEK